MADKDFRFTPDRLRDLVPPVTDRDTYRDTEVKGLELRVAASGVKTFSVYRWVPATRRPERVTLGRFTGKAGGLTIDAARKQAVAILNTINEHRSPALERNKYHASDELEVAFNGYMKDHVRPHLAKKTAQDFQQLYDAYIVPSRLHRKKLVDIERSEVSALHIKIGKEVSGWTANKVAGLIRASYHHVAPDIKPALTNPIKGLTMFATEGRDRFVTEDEFPRFMAALAETPQPFRDLFRFLMLTGVRLGNALSARFDEVDSVHRRWTVLAAKRKFKKTHSVPLDAEAMEIVKRRAAAVPEGTPWLWPTTGKRSSATGHITHVGEAWADLLARAEITDLRRHDLRHTLASYMVMSGEGLPIVGKQLGHESSQSTQRYAHFATDATRGALESTLAKMNAIGAPPMQPKKRKARKA